MLQVTLIPYCKETKFANSKDELKWAHTVIINRTNRGNVSGKYYSILHITMIYIIAAVIIPVYISVYKLLTVMGKFTAMLHLIFLQSE